MDWTLWEGPGCARPCVLEWQNRRRIGVWPGPLSTKNKRRWQTSNAADSKPASMWEHYPPAVPNLFMWC